MSRNLRGQRTALGREMIKWLQDLELSSYPKNPRRDFSNGYLVAEIFSRYYPRDFSIYSYQKGESFSAKQQNWSRIQQSLQNQNLHLTKETVDGTVQCEPGAAERLVQEIYTILTNQGAAGVQTQQSHTLLAPSTVSRDIRTNPTATEITSEAKHLERTAGERTLMPVASAWRGASISFKEIKVKQPVRCLLVNHQKKLKG